MSTNEKRVAVYLRYGNQLNDLELKIPQELYKEFIAQHSGWRFCGFYIDFCPSRPEFERMLNDCRAGEIDLILTRSVSRFSRDITQCLNVLKELHGLSPPVGVYFETEGIESLQFDLKILQLLQEAAIEESKNKSKYMGGHRYEHIRKHQQIFGTEGQGAQPLPRRRHNRFGSNPGKTEN